MGYEIQEFLAIWVFINHSPTCLFSCLNISSALGRITTCNWLFCFWVSGHLHSFQNSNTAHHHPGRQYITLSPFIHTSNWKFPGTLPFYQCTKHTQYTAEWWLRRTACNSMNMFSCSAVPLGDVWELLNATLGEHVMQVTDLRGPTSWRSWGRCTRKRAGATGGAKLLRARETARNCGEHSTVCWVTSTQMRLVSCQRTSSRRSFRTRLTLSAPPLSLHRCTTSRIDRRLHSMSWPRSLLTKWRSWSTRHLARRAS